MYLYSNQPNIVLSTIKTKMFDMFELIGIYNEWVTKNSATPFDQYYFLLHKKTKYHYSNLGELFIRENYNERLQNTPRAAFRNASYTIWGSPGKTHHMIGVILKCCMEYIISNPDIQCITLLWDGIHDACRDTDLLLIWLTEFHFERVVRYCNIDTVSRKASYFQCALSEMKSIPTFI